MCLFKEGESVDGVHLIKSGEVIYEKVIYENDTNVPITKWTQPRLFIGGHF